MQRSMACPDTDAKAVWRFAELSAQQKLYTASAEPAGVTTRVKHQPTSGNLLGIPGGHLRDPRVPENVQMSAFELKTISKKEHACFTRVK